MSWHHPDLYFFLFLLAGFAAFLAIIYELLKQKPRLLDGLRRALIERWMRRRVLFKPSALLAVAALVFGVGAWHVIPDYFSRSVTPVPPTSTTGSACRCEGCGCKGGPGWRGRWGQCVSHANLTNDCGSPPSTRCTHEGAKQVCSSRR